VAQRSAQHSALGAAIRERRRERDLSQEDLAHESGVHRTYVGGIERGERNPSYTNLLRIAAALELPLSQLIARAERSGTAADASAP
jgi:transcriptional regulator with XRE-family HTH domain